MNTAVTRLLSNARAAGHPTVLGENVMNFHLQLFTEFFASASEATS